ncbi:MAG: hypothetical protein ACTJGD_04975 [Mesonia hippocampi]|uniref:hypothetical protein n=1 Tax=Mesonia hippocampi TaxID=1628250 RepID=UPI003F94BC26
MIAKEQLRQVIDELPNQFTIDELVEKMIYLEKYGCLSNPTKDGVFVSRVEIDQAIENWFRH